jgi:hypothetical protein
VKNQHTQSNDASELTMFRFGWKSLVPDSISGEGFCFLPWRIKHEKRPFGGLLQVAVVIWYYAFNSIHNFENTYEKRSFSSLLWCCRSFKSCNCPPCTSHSSQGISAQVMWETHLGTPLYSQRKACRIYAKQPLHCLLARHWAKYCSIPMGMVDPK